MPFEIDRRILLHQTDSAGILFYSKIFELAFDAFSNFLQTCGVSVGYIIRESDYLLPYVHAEADYLLPLSVDDLVKIVLHVEKIGETSFILNYDLLKGGQMAAFVKTVHVAVNKQSGRKMPLPGDIRRGLESFLSH